MIAYFLTAGDDQPSWSAVVVAINEQDAMSFIPEYCKLYLIRAIGVADKDMKRGVVLGCYG